MIENQKKEDTNGEQHRRVQSDAGKRKFKYRIASLDKTGQGTTANGKEKTSRRGGKAAKAQRSRCKKIFQP